MKRFLIIIAVLVCIGAGTGAALQLTGTVDLREYFNKEEDSAEAAFYVSFMDGFFVVDTQGEVIMSTLSEPGDIPQIENMKFNSFIVGKEADAKSSGTLSYVLDVCSLLKAYSLYAGTIEVSDDGELTMYMEDGAFTVILGENDDTDIKIRDLYSLYPNLLEYEGGILYMTSADTNGSGYTFKAASDGEEESTESEDTSESQNTEASDGQEETTSAAETQTAQEETRTSQEETETSSQTQAETSAETQQETTQAETAAETTQEETQEETQEQ